jgi:cytochrome P450
MVNAVEAMQDRLDRLADGRVIAVDEKAAHVTADIIFRTIFSMPLEGAEATRVYREFMDYQEAAASTWLFGIAGLPTFILPSRYRAERSGRKIRSLLEPLVKSRYDDHHSGRPGPEKDILAALLSAKDPETGHVFTLNELVDQVATLFLAGHETTAGALSWAIYLSAMCPHVQDRLSSEAREVMGEREPAFADLKRLKFTRDVFREVLRLYPSFGFIARTCAYDEEMRDKHVKAGSTVSVAPWLIHRHRTHWERPDIFDPNRFQTESGKASLRTAYLPFSLGPRVCLGAAFAMQEAVLILACLARRYRFEPLADHVPKPVGRLTIRSENGVKVRLYRR